MKPRKSRKPESTPEVVPVPVVQAVDIAAGEKLRAVLRTHLGTVASALRYAGTLPPRYCGTKLLIEELINTTATTDAAGRTCLLVAGCRAFLITPDQTSSFDQASGQLVLDLGGQFVALVGA